MTAVRYSILVALAIGLLLLPKSASAQRGRGMFGASKVQLATLNEVQAALEAAGGGKQVLVSAADQRNAKAGSFYEMWFGDGAAALLVGTNDIVAKFIDSYSVSYDFVSHYRGANQRFDYTWEERWVRNEGYLKIIPEAINGLVNKTGLTIEEISKVHVLLPILLGRCIL